MRVYHGPRGEVRAVGFGPDGRTLVANFEYPGLHVWELGSDSPPVHLGRSGSFWDTTLRFSPDGSVVYFNDVGRAGYAVRGGAEVEVGPEAGDRATGFDQTPDMTRLVTLHGTYPGYRLVGWHRDGGSWAKDWEVPAEFSYLPSLAIAPDGRRVAELCIPARGQNRVVIRDAATGNPLDSGRYPYRYRSPLLFRPDGGQLVCAHEMTLLVWPLPEPNVPRAVRNDTRRHFTGAAYHPTGRFLFTTSNDESAVVWDTETWARVRRYTWDVGPLRSVAVSPDGMLAAAGSKKGAVVVWDVDL